MVTGDGRTGELRSLSPAVPLRPEAAQFARRLIAHLRRYADPPLAAELSHLSAIYDDHYDWRLNDATGLGTGQPHGVASAPVRRAGAPGS